MERILFKHAWLMAVLTVLPFVSSGQEKSSVIPLVPAADWRQVDSHPLPLAQISDYGGIPPVDKEYGVKELELRTYQLGKTKTQVVVESATDPIAAYGLLTFYRTAEMQPEKEVHFAFSDAHHTLMVRGEKFLRFLRGKDLPLSASDYQALLVFVGGIKPSAGSMKSMPAPMPPDGLVPGSEKLLLGLEAAKRALPDFRTDLLGFEQGAEAQLGQYQTDKGTSTLMSISYPTPLIARIRYGALSNFLGLNQNHGGDSDYGRRIGTYVFLALHAGSPESAAALMNRFQVSQGVSWDQRYVSERSFTMQLVHMFLAIFLLTAILLGGCIVAGILFFLSRRFAARFFPDAQWGKTDEDQLIRLNLRT